jgi:hypothetical protein
MSIAPFEIQYILEVAYTQIDGKRMIHYVEAAQVSFSCSQIPEVTSKRYYRDELLAFLMDEGLAVAGWSKPDESKTLTFPYKLCLIWLKDIKPQWYIKLTRRKKSGDHIPDENLEFIELCDNLSLVKVADE